MLKKFNGLTEEEYIELCRQKFHESSQDKQTKLVFKGQMREIADSVKAKCPNANAASHLCDAINIIIRCALNIRRMANLKPADIPKAQKIASQVLDIVNHN